MFIMKSWEEKDKERTRQHTVGMRRAEGEAGQACPDLWEPWDLPPQLLHVILTFILLSLRHLADGEDCGHVHTVQYGQEDFG